MPESEQRKYKAKPFNILRGYAGGLLAVQQKYCAVDFGTMTWVGEGPCLRIGEENILSLNMGEANIELSLRLFNERDELMIEIVRNEWISGNPIPWDIKADWQKLTIHNKLRNTSFSLDARGTPLNIAANFWRSGNTISCNRDGIKIMPNNIRMFYLALVGSCLVIDENECRYQPNSAESYIVSHSDRRYRLQQAKELWLRIKRNYSALNQLY